MIHASTVLFVLFLSAISTTVRAEKWLDAGNGVYVDADSASRNGDIATIQARLNASRSLKITFDCRKQLILGYEGNESQKPEPVSADSVAFIAACRRWYEFWK